MRNKIIYAGLPLHHISCACIVLIFILLQNRTQFESFYLTQCFVYTSYYQNQFYAINAYFTSNIFKELWKIWYMVESDDDGGALFVVSRRGVQLLPDNKEEVSAETTY